MLIDDGFAQLPTIAAASVANPPAGTVRLFFDSSNLNRLSQKDSAGAVIDLAASLPVFTSVLTNNLVATTETVVASWAIPANSLAPKDDLDLNLHGEVSSTATLVFRLRMGTTGTPSDALLGQFVTSAAGAASARCYLEALVSILTSTTATGVGRSQLGSGSVGISTATFAAAAINLTVANFITVTLVQSIAQTYTSRAGALKK